MDSKNIIKELKTYTNKKNVLGMARFGIRGKNVLGGPTIPILRKMARKIGKDHKVAGELWDSEIHEAMLLAGFIDDPKLVTEIQMEAWVKGFDSWDICDQVCSSLFDKTPFAYRKAFEWTKREEEFVKRAGYVLIATLSVHDKEASDEKLMKFFPIIKNGSTDERNFVKKAVNWALRQIGKRNKKLNIEAIKLVKKIIKIDSKSARWIAGDALRELEKKKF